MTQLLVVYILYAFRNTRWSDFQEVFSSSLGDTLRQTIKAEQLHWNICSKILSRAQMRSSGLVHSGGASTSEEYGVTFSTPEAHHCLTKLQCMPVMTPHLLTSKVRCTGTTSAKSSKFKDFMHRVKTVATEIFKTTFHKL